MSQRLTDAQIREHLDRNYPFIGQDEEPPGRWQPYDNGQSGQRWSGKHGWRTRHGTAIVRWDLARPLHVSGAKLADGSHVDVQNSMGAWRYQASEHPRRWVHGTVDIQPGGVTFTPGEQPKYVPPESNDQPNLYADLAEDKALRERLLDEDVADALYEYLKNQEFFKQGGERIWSNGLSGTAGFVANLRGQGDVYIDYYPHGSQLPQSALAARIAEVKTVLARLGWRLVTAEDRNIAAVATRRDLASWEARPEGVTADWVAKIQAPRPPSPGAIRLLKKHPNQMTEAERARDTEIVTQALPKRLHSLAMSGRISEAEYREMAGRIARIP